MPHALAPCIDDIHKRLTLNLSVSCFLEIDCDLHRRTSETIDSGQRLYPDANNDGGSVVNFACEHRPKVSARPNGMKFQPNHAGPFRRIDFPDRWRFRPVGSSPVILQLDK